jgi:hypothetical protein
MHRQVLFENSNLIPALQQLFISKQNDVLFKVVYLLL